MCRWCIEGQKNQQGCRSNQKAKRAGLKFHNRQMAMRITEQIYEEIATRKCHAWPSDWIECSRETLDAIVKEVGSLHWVDSLDGTKRIELYGLYIKLNPYIPLGLFYVKAEGQNGVACYSGSGSEQSQAMILVDHQIRKLCEEGLVTPYDPSLVNPASLDLRLGNWIKVEADLKIGQGWANSVAYDDVCIEKFSQEKPYWLAPNQFILAESMEVFHMPDNVCGKYVQKSSRAREGMDHLNAGYADCGWSGSRLTFEFKNLLQRHGVAIWPGMKCGQMIFWNTAEMPEQSYSVVGNYNNDLRVTASKGHL